MEPAYTEESDIGMWEYREGKLIVWCRDRWFEINRKAIKTYCKLYDIDAAGGAFDNDCRNQLARNLAHITDIKRAKHYHKSDSQAGNDKPKNMWHYHGPELVFHVVGSQVRGMHIRFAGAYIED